MEKRFEVGTKSEDSRRGARVWGGNVASFPFLFGSINLSPFLRCFSYHDLEQEGLGGSNAWSDLCLHCSKLRWRALCGCAGASLRAALWERDLESTALPHTLVGDLLNVHSAGVGCQQNLEGCLSASMEFPCVKRLCLNLRKNSREESWCCSAVVCLV